MRKKNLWDRVDHLASYSDTESFTQLEKTEIEIERDLIDMLPYSWGQYIRNSKYVDSAFYLKKN